MRDTQRAAASLCLYYITYKMEEMAMIAVLVHTRGQYGIQNLGDGP
jgi:hypothetical protein